MKEVEIGNLLDNIGRQDYQLANTDSLNGKNGHNNNNNNKNGQAVHNNNNNGTPVEINGRAAPAESPPTTTNGKTAPQLSNGKSSPMPTAPEVNEWTTLMSEGMTMTKDTNHNHPTGSHHSIDPYLQDLSEYDLEQIQVYWERILPRVSYLGTERVVPVYNALRVAYRAHRSQRRKSGEPFVVHPVEVALLLAELRMDHETVVAGLLHDTVEDTDLTFEDVESMFGTVVRSIVEGETKVSKLPKLGFADFADEQAENLRQMFVAMSDDYRIIIVKLADRLHNMRTLQFMKPHKQIKISRETLDIFAPLAHRMGIWQFKSELEDTAFMYLFPQEYKRLKQRLVQHQSKFQETLDVTKNTLQKTLLHDATLRSQAKDVEIYGRTKELYSLFHKMETKNVRNLNHITDVVALRVIITPNKDGLGGNDQNGGAADSLVVDRGVWLCYHVLALVQHLPGYLPVPTKVKLFVVVFIVVVVVVVVCCCSFCVCAPIQVKDYISFPKPNGYQSLHTALMLNGQSVEVQIRTSAMHQVAEYGMASHWSYKSASKAADLFNTPWLSSIKEWQDDSVNSRDFVDSVRSELLGKRVFVFLRNGKILNLSRGATVIDAAFQIHSEVGIAMHGAEINGKAVPFSYELRNGDVVSILTGEGKPATDWMRYAKSRSTRSKLRSYFRRKQKESLREAGKILVMDYLWMYGDLIERLSFRNDTVIAPTTVEELEEYLPGKSRYEDIDEYLIDCGKRHDRAFLHNTVSKIFCVPQRALRNAEKKRKSLVPNTVSAIVDESRHVAEVAAAIVNDDLSSRVAEVLSNNNNNNNNNSNDDATMIIKGTVNGNVVEYADPEHLCQDCLPIPGDEIVGTRPLNEDAVALVHRVGCPHAQRALNQALANSRYPTSVTESNNIGGGGGKPFRVDSQTLRSVKGVFSTATQRTNLVPVKLRWSSDKHVEDDDIFFMAEVVVVAEDRKLLLADCSQIVSENAEIVKTGSSTTEEHAMLLYLVQVQNIRELQNLMDKLTNVQSVMSVERRVRSVLLLLLSCCTVDSQCVFPCGQFGSELL